MKINRTSLTLGLIFITIELLLFGYFNQHWIQCPPCSTTSDCPICLSSEQEFSLWMAGLIATAYLSLILFRYLKHRSLHL